MTPHNLALQRTIVLPSLASLGRPLAAAAVIFFNAGCGSVQTQPCVRADRGTVGAAWPVGLDGLKFENSLAECVTFTPLRLQASQDVGLLIVSSENKRAISECGCASKILRYSVSEALLVDDEPEEYERTFGRIVLRDTQREHELVLATDRTLFDIKAAKVTVACSPPD